MSWWDDLISALRLATGDVKVIREDMKEIKADIRRLLDIELRVNTISKDSDFNLKQVREVEKRLNIHKDECEKIKVEKYANITADLSGRLKIVENTVGNGPSQKCEERFKYLEGTMNNGPSPNCEKRFKGIERQLPSHTNRIASIERKLNLKKS